MLIKKSILFVSFFAVLAMVALLRRPAGYELSLVDSSLRNLATPYRSVSTFYYLDGGSIGIRIVDRDARTLELALPIAAGHGWSYQHLFVGATHISKAGAVEVAFSEDTRRMLISIVEQHRVPGSDSDIALLALRGAPLDYVRIAARAAANLFN